MPPQNPKQMQGYDNWKLAEPDSFDPPMHNHEITINVICGEGQFEIQKNILLEYVIIIEETILSVDDGTTDVDWVCEYQSQFEWEDGAACDLKSSLVIAGLDINDYHL